MCEWMLFVTITVSSAHTTTSPRSGVVCACVRYGVQGVRVCWSAVAGCVACGGVCSLRDGAEVQQQGGVQRVVGGGRHGVAVGVAQRQRRRGRGAHRGRARRRHSQPQAQLVRLAPQDHATVTN